LPGLSFTFQPQTIKVAHSGDLAYEIGTYSLSYDGDQGRVQDMGKYLVVWEKVDGDWKAMVDTDNSDLPAP
jgi:ketosteroid isomerase-like protein